MVCVMNFAEVGHDCLELDHSWFVPVGAGFSRKVLEGGSAILRRLLLRLLTGLHRPWAAPSCADHEIRFFGKDGKPRYTVPGKASGEEYVVQFAGTCPQGSATRTAEPDQSDRSSVKLNIAPDRSQFPQRGQSTLMISLYALNLSVVACFELESDLLLDVEVMQHVESWKGELTK